MLEYKIRVKGVVSASSTERVIRDLREAGESGAFNVRGSLVPSGVRWADASMQVVVQGMLRGLSVVVRAEVEPHGAGSRVLICESLSLHELSFVALIVSAFVILGVAIDNWCTAIPALVVAVVLGGEALVRGRVVAASVRRIAGRNGAA